MEIEPQNLMSLPLASFCRGIRIKDAASKRQVKELLAAEESMREMLEEAPAAPAPATAGKTPKAAAAKAVKKVKKLLKKKPGPMALG